MKSNDLLSHFLTGAVMGAAIAALISPLSEFLACRIFQHDFRWMDVAICIVLTASVDGIWMIFYQAGKKKR